MTSTTTIDEPLFEYLSFGSTFRRTFVIFYKRYDVFLILSSIVVIPYALLMLSIHRFLASFYIQQEEEEESSSSTSTTEHPTHHIPMIVLVLTLQLAIYTIITIFGRAAIIKAVCILFYINNGQEERSERSLFSIVLSCLKLSKDKACQLQKIIGPIIPIQRSWELCIGSRCYIFCCLMLLFIINNITIRLLHNIFDSDNDQTVIDILLSITGIIVQTLPMIFFFPLHAILETVIYLNLRIGRESMNQQILSGDLMMSSSSSGGIGGNNITTTTTNNVYLPVSISSSDPTEGGGSGSCSGIGGSSSMMMMMRIGGNGSGSSDYRNVPLMDTLDNNNNNNNTMEESITFEHPTTTTTTTTTTTVISEMV